MFLERSSNHLVWFRKLRQHQDHSNLDWIDDCTYFPFSCKLNKSNNIQSDHQHFTPFPLWFFLPIWFSWWFCNSNSKTWWVFNKDQQFCSWYTQGILFRLSQTTWIKGTGCLFANSHCWVCFHNWIATEWQWCPEYQWPEWLFTSVYSRCFHRGVVFSLYCDGIFSILAIILPRFWNSTPELQMKMSSLRECIKHVLANHCNRFKLFSVPRHLHLFKSGVKICQLCLVSFFTSNCFYCLCGTRSRYFGQILLTLEEFLLLDEGLIPPPPVVLGQIWDYGSNINLD